MAVYTRSATAEVIYNGYKITTTIEKYVTSISYKDNASDESDNFSLNISDQNDEWINGWFPEKGEKISSVISVKNWLHENDNRNLLTGNLIIDNIAVSGSPTALSIGAVSKPANESFAETAKNRTWEKTTLKQIAADIAKAAGIAFVFDASDISIAAQEQSNDTDSSFLMNLCDLYGLSMKVYNSKLIIFDREKYKLKDAVSTIYKGDLKSWNFNTTLAGSYTGGTLTYTDPNTEKDITFSIGGGNRILNANISASSKADAELKLKAAINKENHNITTLSITIMGNPSLFASQNINISGLSKIDGKYYINSITHDIGSSGYTSSLELSKIETITSANTNNKNLTAGTVMTLSKVNLYVSSTASQRANVVTGTYYLYDGKIINNRCRITNSVGRVGKTPIGANVTGWIDISDVS